MFDKLLGKLPSGKGKQSKNDLDKGQVAFAPNTKIAFKPALISTLEQEHSDLLSLYWDTLTAAQNRQIALTRKLLIEFKAQLVDHLLKENTSLYIYLRHALKKPSARQAVKSLKVEMDEIGRKVKVFLDNAIENESSFDGRFLAEFKKIGDVLAQRIETEEEFVYPNYQPATP